ncbi:MAG: hypothetical protein IJX80_09410 [Clostridia bacterium]|nr:hypothetical protein [Clostridia bacterium]
MISLFKIGANGQKTFNGKMCLLLIAAIAGIILILIGSSATAVDTPTENVTYTTETDELVIYQRYLEDRVQALCESVNGVSQVTVAVTLSGTFESIYATEFREGNEEYVILGSGSSAKALYLTRAAPDIAGIGIVCHGGGNEIVRCELISLLAATFHVSTNRIYVTEARG